MDKRSESGIVRPVVVVGAGLAGCAAALMLASRGMKVELYEKRHLERDFDLELPESADKEFLGHSADASKRSINLALSERGMQALRRCGVLEEVMRGAIPMYGRRMHDKSGSLTFMSYGHTSDRIYSVGRGLMNEVLLNAALRHENISVHFGYSLLSMTKDCQLKFNKHGDMVRVDASYVIGTDGAYSAVRRGILRHSRADFSRQYIPHGYKELTIPAAADGGFSLPDEQALHIWPRGSMMLIGLPNPDKTFTCTLFAPFKVFDALKCKEDVEDFFAEHFADAVPLMPRLLDEFFENPTGAMVTCKMDPWNLGKRAVVLGDAAHAIVPFYGQGANSGLEDTLVLDEILTEMDGVLSEAIPVFAARRKRDADALADLSFQNYIEMRSHTASRAFLLRMRMENVLNKMLPRAWIPLYSMVAFTRIPYAKCIAKSDRQNRILRFAKRVGSVALAAGAATLAKKQGLF
eukprot:PLAT13407.1.p1 GENE.PLAT13407.1~~PLAT13407.1.p1  ORF type:complete len:464 (-),score=261.26 PLAT13407.1:97-1488(-)